MFRGSVKGTGYTLHSLVSPSLPLPGSPCAITFQPDPTNTFKSIRVYRLLTQCNLVCYLNSEQIATKVVRFLHQIDNVLCLVPTESLNVIQDNLSLPAGKKIFTFLFTFQGIHFSFKTDLLSIKGPAVLYGCETWSLSLRKERKLRVFENMMLRRMFGPGRDEVTVKWRRLRNEELNDFYSSPNIVRVIKSRRMRWILVGKP